MAATNVLSRPISVYSIPPPSLDALTVRSIQAQTLSQQTHNDAQQIEPVPEQEPTTTASTGLGCQTCPGASFDTPEDQRAHFKSDWHRYNAKAKVGGQKIVTADEWENMVEGVSSISGSASSASTSSSRSRITKLSKKTQIKDNDKNDVDSDEEAEIAESQRRAQSRTAVIWFTAPDAPPSSSIPTNTQFGVHRALSPSSQTAGDYLSESKRLQLAPPTPDEEERRITLLMVAGGHFAGMVISSRPKGKNEPQAVKGAGEVRVLKHKTFHRYTTRKKQGGSQGLNDNAKSKAVSAGAMLRRYGEQALQDEIRESLSEWEEDSNLSERIFIRASTHGKKSFWGYDGAVLDKSDDRIRSFPFPTRRPTQQELLRCWHELTKSKISHLSEEASQAQDDAYMASLQPKKQAVAAKPAAPAPAPVPAAPELSPEEEAKSDRQRRSADMIKKGRLDALRSFVEKYRSEITPAASGQAAADGQEDIVRYSSTDGKLDPAAPIDGNKRAYDMAQTKGVRNVFRRVAYDNPTMWDWQGAHVPSGSSEEAAAEQGAKKAERRRGLRDKMREKEKARAEAAAEEEEREKAEAAAQAAAQPKGAFGGLGSPSAGPQKLGGRGAEGGLAGLSPEMRMQIERERRARAAEARFGKK